ncbi:MAG: DUF488 family protein [Dehalococcoidia bacterium]
MKIYTIGFTRKSAREFFGIVRSNSIRQVVDVRINVSQLAGFAKRDDLKYFLTELCGTDYYHFEFLAPTKKMRDEYVLSKNWDVYAREYTELLARRNVLDELDRSFLDSETCFLCSEASPDKCHRSLLTQYLQEHWEDVEVTHL